MSTIRGARGDKINAKFNDDQISVLMFGEEKIGGLECPAHEGGQWEWAELA
jgi:hypothetical protein